jgi:D-beta-D-heptose 7-phosphate kinase/D-beta-D-heptose 1-phosphate adenosyltransferase
MKVILCTGGFDPIHSGHISYLNHADHLRDKSESWLVVGLNSDDWLTRKKGRPFMPWQDRMVVLDNLHMTDMVIDFDDSDNSAKHAIQMVRQSYPTDEIIFDNGVFELPRHILSSFSTATFNSFVNLLNFGSIPAVGEII